MSWASNAMSRALILGSRFLDKVYIPGRGTIINRSSDCLRLLIAVVRSFDCAFVNLSSGIGGVRCRCSGIGCRFDLRSGDSLGCDVGRPCDWGNFSTLVNIGS